MTGLLLRMLGCHWLSGAPLPARPLQPGGLLSAGLLPSRLWLLACVSASFPRRKDWIASLVMVHGRRSLLSGALPQAREAPSGSPPRMGFGWLPALVTGLWPAWLSHGVNALRREVWAGVGGTQEEIKWSLTSVASSSGRNREGGQPRAGAAPKLGKTRLCRKCVLPKCMQATATRPLP